MKKLFLIIAIFYISVPYIVFGTPAVSSSFQSQQDDAPPFYLQPIPISNSSSIIDISKPAQKAKLDILSLSRFFQQSSKQVDLHNPLKTSTPSTLTITYPSFFDADRYKIEYKKKKEGINKISKFFIKKGLMVNILPQSKGIGISFIITNKNNTSFEIDNILGYLLEDEFNIVGLEYQIMSMMIKRGMNIKSSNYSTEFALPQTKSRYFIRKFKGCFAAKTILF